MTRKDIIDTEKRMPAENARTFLISVCSIFTAVMVVCMAFGTAFSDEGSRMGIMYCWCVRPLRQINGERLGEGAFAA